MFNAQFIIFPHLEEMRSFVPAGVGRGHRHRLGDHANHIVVGRASCGLAQARLQADWCKAASSKQQAARRKQQGASTKHQGASSKEQAASTKHQAARRKQQGASSKSYLLYLGTKAIHCDHQNVRIFSTVEFFMLVDT